MDATEPEFTASDIAERFIRHYNQSMAQILNLRIARKQKARDKARKEADANALRHGRTPAQIRRDTAEADKARSFLDAHIRDTDTEQ